MLGTTNKETLLENNRMTQKPRSGIVEAVQDAYGLNATPTLQEFRDEIYRIRLERNSLAVRIQDLERPHKELSNPERDRLLRAIRRMKKAAHRWREWCWNANERAANAKVKIKHSKEILEQLVARALDYE